MVILLLLSFQITEYIFEHRESNHDKGYTLVEGDNGSGLNCLYEIDCVRKID